MQKLIIVTAPSGAGKTTIVHHLLQAFDELAFSVSATNRPKRPHEHDGVDYYFLSTEEFRTRVAQGEFLEWEEVYADQYYGTLKSEIHRLWNAGKSIIFDVDVKGAQNIKRAYPDESLAIFIKPPSVDVLLERLRRRMTETPESLQRRIHRAQTELTYEHQFDRIVVNDKLEIALEEAEDIVRSYLY